MLLTIERHETIRRFTGIVLRVLVDGEEVTHCFAADNEMGWAARFRTNENGARYREHDKAAVEVLTGNVTFVRAADPDVER